MLKKSQEKIEKTLHLFLKMHRQPHRHAATFGNFEKMLAASFLSWTLMKQVEDAPEITVFRYQPSEYPVQHSAITLNGDWKIYNVKYNKHVLDKGDQGVIFNKMTT